MTKWSSENIFGRNRLVNFDTSSVSYRTEKKNENLFGRNLVKAPPFIGHLFCVFWRLISVEESKKKKIRKKFEAPHPHTESHQQHLTPSISPQIEQIIIVTLILFQLRNFTRVPVNCFPPKKVKNMVIWL